MIISTQIPQPWASLGPWGAQGLQELRGYLEALDKSPGVVFHAEFDFQVKTSQNIAKIMTNTLFSKFSFFVEIFEKIYVS